MDLNIFLFGQSVWRYTLELVVLFGEREKIFQGELQTRRCLQTVTSVYLEIVCDQVHTF